MKSIKVTDKTENPEFKLDSISKILLVEDSNTAVSAVKKALDMGLESPEAVEIVHRSTLEGGIKLVKGAQADAFDVALIDLGLPDSSGLDTLRRFKAANNTLPVIVLTGTDNTALSIEALRLGAQNYLIKDETYSRTLQREIRNAVMRKKLESSLQAAKEEAEESTLIKDKFISMVAHDMRNPLTSILTTLETLTVKHANALPDTGQQQLERVTRNANTLQKIIDELLDISRLRTGKARQKRRFVDAFYTVDKLVKSLEALAEEKTIKLEVDIAKGQRMYTDPPLLGQVFHNLITNALKFSHPGGVVRLFNDPDSPGAIFVEDKGVGIAPDRLQKIFRIEDNESTPGTQGEKGTGFGMPYSREVMESLGGSLEVSSVEGEGSLFKVVLPTVAPKVLVVEDDLVIRQLVKMLLLAIDVEVTEVENGSEALELIERGYTPHLILTDILMPKMSGFEMLKILKSESATQAIPVIMITGDDNIETRNEALRLGALDYTVKPINISDFLPRVRRVIA